MIVTNFIKIMILVVVSIVIIVFFLPRIFSVLFYGYCIINNDNIINNHISDLNLTGNDLFDDYNKMHTWRKDNVIVLWDKNYYIKDIVLKVQTPEDLIKTNNKKYKFVFDPGTQAPISAFILNKTGNCGSGSKYLTTLLNKKEYNSRMIKFKYIDQNTGKLIYWDHVWVEVNYNNKRYFIESFDSNNNLDSNISDFITKIKCWGWSNKRIWQFVDENSIFYAYDENLTETDVTNQYLPYILDAKISGLIDYPIDCEK